MALKMTAGSWTSAQRENRSQRDTEREKFFSEAGVSPAKSLREVYLSPEKRVGQFAKALGMAGQNRIGDPNLGHITTIAALSLGGYGMTGRSLAGLLDTQPLGIVSLSPEVLQNFFITAPDSTLRKSLF